MALENFGARFGESARLTLAFMVAVFLTWAISGYMAQQNASRGSLALMACCWSAVAGDLIAAAFGFTLMSLNVPAADYVATWPEFKSSGWSDAHAFAIGNSPEAGFTHLLNGIGSRYCF